MLPAPGTPGFTPNLVAAVADDPSLRGYEPDPPLLAVLLLSLIVQCGGVIVDVSTTRSLSPATSAARVSRAVAALTESVFGLDTRMLHLGPASYSSEVKLDSTTEALVVTGLEDAPHPVLIKLRSEVAKERARKPLLIWVRPEDREDAVPSWLLDLFACSTPCSLRDIEQPPMGLARTALIPADYIQDLRDLLILTHVHPPLELHISNLIAAACLHPQLEADISQRGSHALTQLVKAQRLLSAPFPLPRAWQTSLAAWRRANDPTQRPVVRGGGGRNPGDVSYSGGPGGVSTWAVRAGEVPTAETMLGYGAEDWYCTPDNVAGAFELAIRHRLRVRRPGEAQLYALDGTARERVANERKHETEHEARDAARKKRIVLDEALEGMLLTV